MSDPNEASPFEEPKMEIHKPKPVRNWRGYLKEYAIIVVGVLTALGAQQAAEWWRWRSEVTQARQTIASEMARNIAYGIRRMTIVRCMETRLWAIEDILDEASRKGALPALGATGGTPNTPWSTAAWESVVASQTATHFSRKELAALSLIYTRVARVDAWNRQESEVWSTLQTMPGRGRRYEAAHDTDLRKALGLAEHYNWSIADNSQGFIQDTLSLNLPFTPEERQLMSAAETVPQGMAPLCGPISTTARLHGIQIRPPIYQRINDTLKQQPWRAP